VDLPLTNTFGISSSTATRSDFLEQSNDFLLHLPGASWIAIDLEMTGIQLPDSKRPGKDETPSERYHTIKQVPEKYSIIQLGVCLFHQAGTVETDTVNGCQFLVRKYKFTIFPSGERGSSGREVVLNPSAIHFLKENNMNFDTWVSAGIPFALPDTAADAVDAFIKKHRAIREWSPEPPVSPSARKKVVLSREDDKQFHARSMASLREWLDAPIPQRRYNNVVYPPEGASLLLPECNSFLRRSLYEAIGREYPYLITETQSNRICVWRLTPSELKLRNERLLREEFEDLIQEKVGAYRIFLALTKACRGDGTLSRTERILLSPEAQEWMLEENPAFNPLESWASPIHQTLHPTQSQLQPKPIVVHNGLMDLLFLLTHFHSPTLPSEWGDCKRLIRSYFPVIYDTKCMASYYSIRDNPRARTQLSSVYEQVIANNPQWEMVFQTGNGRDDQAHDAAFDAYMTGVAFCGLSFTIQDQCKIPAVETSTRFALWGMTDLALARSFYGCNKLFFFASPYVIDLESSGNNDPFRKGLSSSACFKMSGFEEVVNNSDIYQCLSSLTDSSNRRINFETFWIDGNTIVIAVLIREFQHNEKMFVDHGKIVKDALRSSFGEKVAIEPLTSSPDSKPKKQKKRSLWNLWGLLGTKDDATDDPDTDDNDRPGKRRRVS
jgi:poly(A)-specific ribonuclease